MALFHESSLLTKKIQRCRCNAHGLRSCESHVAYDADRNPLRSDAVCPQKIAGKCLGSMCTKRTHSPERRPRYARFQRPFDPEVDIDPGFRAPLPVDPTHAEAGPLPASGPQTATLFQGWGYSSPRIRVGVCRGHQRVCQPACVNPQLACWRVCCVAFAR
jgi:hypothetical protein